MKKKKKKTLHYNDNTLCLFHLCFVFDSALLPKSGDKYMAIKMGKNVVLIEQIGFQFVSYSTMYHIPRFDLYLIKLKSQLLVSVKPEKTIRLGSFERKIPGILNVISSWQ